MLALAAAFVGWRWYKQPSQPAIDYKTAAITRGDLTQAVTANGQLSPVKNVAVGSQVSGIITDMRADFNSKVTNGQIIAQIDPSTYQQNITQTEAELANSRAALEYADINARRGKELLANKLIAPSEHEKLIADLHQAEAGVKMREALLQKARVDLERATIYSPIDGIVISRMVDIGQTVAASFNAPTLFTIANDLHNMRIEAMVSEADVGGVQEGQRVNFSVDAFPGRQFRGQITQVRFAPSTNQNVVTYTAVVEVNNDDLKLRPGMTANASIVTGERRDVLRIPNSALRFRPPEGAVVKGATNAPGAFTRGTNRAPADIAMGAPGGSEGRGGGEGAPNREEMRRRFENMSPEERTQARERMRARFGDRGGGTRGERSAQEGPITRTVYVLEKGSGSATNASRASSLSGLLPFFGSSLPAGPELKPTMVKTGISDGSHTEVIEGLKEGDVVVTGLNLPASATGPNATGPRPAGSPFGGPFGGGGMRR